MLQTIITSVLAAIILGLLTLLGKHYFTKPIINIYFESGQSMSTGADNPKFVKYQWKPILTFKNNSKNDAKNLKIIWPPDLPHIELSFGQDDYLKATNSIKKQIVFEKLITNEEVQKANSGDRLQFFYPQELKNLSFVLCYENEYGNKFYIRLKKNDKDVIFDKKPHWIKPKFKKEFSLVIK